jgi:hypothetical protein
VDRVTDIRSDALFILLVEKDAAFMRLAEDRFYNAHPCIIMTAKGQPDVASRWDMIVDWWGVMIDANEEGVAHRPKKQQKRAPSPRQTKKN